MSSISRFSSLWLIALLGLILGARLAGASGIEPQTGIVSAPDDVAIHYSTYSTGSPALVFVHGISCDQGYWKEQVGPFSEGFQVVTLDLAGHGESGLERESWSMEAYGADVAAVVEGLDLRSVILIGHSMGGPVILEAARQLPDLVDGIVIVDTYEALDTWSTPEQIDAIVMPFREDFLEETRAWVRTMFAEDSDPESVERIVTDMASAPPEVALPSLESALEKMLGRDRTTALQGLRAPVFMINADFIPSDVADLERHAAKVHLLPGTGHFFMLEKPAEFNAALSDVIQKIAGSP
jgi:pimeloyl-ACP methyl ester carboxylesterase